MDLTLIEAWNLWWSGQQLTDHTLYGVSMIWLGRGGKFLSFIAGFAIILDIIGPDRLRSRFQKILGESDIELHVRAARAVRICLLIILGIAVLVYTVIGVHSIAVSGWQETLDAHQGIGVMPNGDKALQLFVVAAVGFLIAVLGGTILKFISALFSHSGFATGVRVVSFVLFLVGFALDYLAS